jgi:hypothetical protein
MATVTEPEITEEIKEVMERDMALAKKQGHRVNDWKWNGSYRWEVECFCGQIMYVFQDDGGDILCLGALKNFPCALKESIKNRGHKLSPLFYCILNLSKKR